MIPFKTNRFLISGLVIFLIVLLSGVIVFDCFKTDYTYELTIVNVVQRGPRFLEASDGSIWEIDHSIHTLHVNNDAFIGIAKH